MQTNISRIFRLPCRILIRLGVCACAVGGSSDISIIFPAIHCLVKKVILLLLRSLVTIIVPWFLSCRQVRERVRQGDTYIHGSK
jgi:hypothetical protein